MKCNLSETVIYSNLYLSLGASIVAYATIFLFNFTLSPEAIFIPFGAGMFIYNLNRLTDKEEDIINVPKRLGFSREYGSYLLIFGSALYLLALLLSFLKGLIVFFVVLFPGIVGILYCILRLKKTLFIKNLLVAVSWGITPLFVGFYFNTFNLGIILLSMFFGMEFFINTVIFDIKDTMGDYNQKIHTLPIKLGLNKTKKICYTLNFIITLALVVSVLIHILPTTSLLLLFLSFYVFLYTFFSGRGKNTLYYGVFVDGEFIFLLFVILIANILL